MFDHPETIIVPVVFLTFFGALKVFFDYRLKRRMVDKGVIQEGKYLLLDNPVWQPLSSIKWGLVLVGIGLAILLAQIFPRSISDQAMLGLMFLFAGIGFLVYFLVAQKHEQNRPLNPPGELGTSTIGQELPDPE